jgi:TetR/AcrR family transcriptional repressor of nem operon
MARPREFDEDEVLDAAMHLFWAKGYEAVSLDDLLGAMGIARGSLYKAFRSKRDVYMAALARYDRTVVEAAVTMLRDSRSGDGAARVQRFLLSAVEPIGSEGDRRGCFLCNAAVDRAQMDSEVAERVTAMMRRIEAAIAAALATAAQPPELDEADRTQWARHLLTVYMGLRVLARAGYPAAELRRIARAQVGRPGSGEGTKSSRGQDFPSG